MKMFYSFNQGHFRVLFDRKNWCHQNIITVEIKILFYYIKELFEFKTINNVPCYVHQI